MSRCSFIERPGIVAFLSSNPGTSNQATMKSTSRFEAVISSNIYSLYLNYLADSSCLLTGDGTPFSKITDLIVSGSGMLNDLICICIFIKCVDVCKLCVMELRHTGTHR